MFEKSFPYFAFGQGTNLTETGTEKAISQTTSPFEVFHKAVFDRRERFHATIGQ